MTGQLTQDESVKAMYALGEAGPEHRLIAPMAGEWNVTMRLFAGRNETIVSKGMKARKRSVLEGRQIMEEIYEGSIAGIEHRKLTMLGFNAVNGRYEFVTADNMDTQQMVYRGVRDPKTGSIVMTAPYTQAAYAEIVSGDGISRASGKPTSRRATVGLEMIIRDVLRIQNDDRHLLQMYFHPAGGEEALGVEYEYVRA